MGSLEALSFNFAQLLTAAHKLLMSEYKQLTLDLQKV